MKFLTAISALAATALAQTNPVPATTVPTYNAYKQNSIYIEKNFNRGGMYNSIQQALEAGYNRLYVGFYYRLYGCFGACAEWTTVLSTNQRNNVKNLLASYNAEIFLSVGGPGEYWESCIQTDCGSDFGNEVGAFAAKYNFDGVDLNVNLIGQGTEPSGFALNGTFVSMVQDLSTATKSAGNFDRSHVVVSAAAPYYSIDFVEGDVTHSLAYLCLDSNESQPWATGDCNMMMYNEGTASNANYMTYQDVFITNTFDDPYYSNFGQGSAVKEVAALGVDSSKLAVIKPTTPYETSVTSGYVNPITLGMWGCSAQDDFSWNGGFIAWTWDSRTQSDLSTTLNFVKQTAGDMC